MTHQTDTMKIKGKMEYDYDKDADVLYMSFGKPVPATSIEMGNGVLVRVDDGMDVVGITMIDFTRRLHDKLGEIQGGEDHEH